ncbi:hypothetical protein BG004_004975 [Podila humilis]|nr:hypothetical protein BG004_004975 [Podila humilis]
MSTNVKHITISELFTKACSVLEHSQGLSIASQVSTIAESSSQQQQKAPFVSFQGVVVAFSPQTSVTAASTASAAGARFASMRAQTPNEFSAASRIHSQAHRTFAKLNKPPRQDQPQRTERYSVVIWAAEELPSVASNQVVGSKKRKGNSKADSARSTVSTPASAQGMFTSSRNDRPEGDKDCVIEVAESDEDNRSETTDKDHDEEDRDASAVSSWSDSYASSESEGNSGLQGGYNSPRKLVAVFLSDQCRTDKDELGDTFVALNRIQIGDNIRVQNALLLVQMGPGDGGGNADEPIVSCVGVPSKTMFFVSRAQEIAPASMCLGSVPYKDVVVTNSKAKSAKRRQSIGEASTVEISTSAYRSDCVIGSSQELAKNQQTKRQKTKIDEVIVVSSQEPTSPYKERFESSTTTNTSASIGTPLMYQKPRHTSELDPLDLFVRNRSQPSVLSPHITQLPHSPLIFFSDIWTSSVTADVKQKDKMYQASNPVVQCHLCWKTLLESLMIRALCAECGNDYKQLSCTFGCQSRRWKLFIKLQCQVSDGTAEATVKIEGTDDTCKQNVAQSKEDMMWAILGLSRKATSPDHRAPAGSLVSSQGVPFKDVKSKILQILARRGELSFHCKLDASSNANSARVKADNGSKSNTNKHETRAVKRTSTKVDGINSSSGSVSSIGDDQTQRAKSEERLWLKVCTDGMSPSFVNREGRTSDQEYFILQAVKSEEPSRSAKQPLHKKYMWIGRQAVHTLCPPPLILRAVQVHGVSSLVLSKLQATSIGNNHEI